MKRLEAKLKPEVLKGVREYLGVKSVKDMADMLGVSLNTYLSWEAGKRPIPLIAEKLVSALVKNVEIVETMMFIEHYMKMALRAPDIAERLRAFYPHFDIEQVTTRPIAEFVYSTLAAVPLEHVRGRIQELHEGNHVTSPWRMKKILAEGDLDP